MIVHALAGLIGIYVLIRLILPLPLGGKSKLVAAALLLLASQQHLIIRHTFGGMASPELPVPLLLASGWIFVSLIFVLLVLLVRDAFLLSRWLFRSLAFRGERARNGPPFSQDRRQAILTALVMIPAAYGIRQGVIAPDVHTTQARLPRLPQELDGLTLVQISDLHVSPLLQKERVRAVVDRVNALDADVVLFTGDIVDGLPSRRAASVAPLRDLRARYGVFGCVGNHEYYGDYAAWMRVLPDLGLRMLLNEHVVLKLRGRNVVLAGLTDMVAERFALPGPDLARALDGAPRDALRILLDHRPGNAPDNAGAGVDLQLSGHTHGGHMLGMRHLVARFNGGFLQGWYPLGGMQLYVSSGAGLWNGFPVRLGVPSEVVRIVLRSEKI